MESIVVALDSSPYARAARDFAIDIAAAANASLTGLCVVDIRVEVEELPPYLVSGAHVFESPTSSDESSSALEGLRARAGAARAGNILSLFTKAADEACVSSHARLEEGVPGHIIADIGGLYDLIVMGKHGLHARWRKDLLGSNAESVARRASVPVLLVNESYQRPDEVLVLYDGSEPASNALRLSVVLARAMGLKVRVITAAESAGGAEVIQARIGALAGESGVEVVLEPRQGDIVSMTAKEHGQALLAVGKQGRSALYKLFLGSTTAQLMREFSGPVLIVP